jgi:HEAT repeat protein
VAVLAAGAARADDGPGRPRRGDDFRFSPPEAEGSRERAAEPSRAPAPPADPAWDLVQGLSTWPAQSGVKAAESLLLKGSEAVPALVRALQGKESAVKPGAAWVLGRVGEPAHVRMILSEAAERRSGSHLEAFFEAAYELDPAVSKRWLFSFLVLERPVFRGRATDFLAGVLGPEDRPEVEKLLASSKSGVEVAGLVLLSRLDPVAAREHLLAALADPIADVARRASQLLAQDGDPSLLARLNALAREGDARTRAYATLAIVEASRASRESAFEPATVSDLATRRGIHHPDKLSRGAAAVGLVFGGLESDDPAVADLLDRTVVDVLVDTVGGDHFRDFSSLSDPVFAALRRLSGLDLAPSARAWALWWQEQRGKFRARRLLSGVAEEDLLHARVTFDVVDADGRRRRTTFVSEGGDRVEGAYVVPPPAFRALVDGLEEAGIFREKDDARTVAEEHLAVRVGVWNQEKRVVLEPSRDEARHAVLSARLRALEETNRWQRFRDLDQWPDAEAWWAHHAQVFATADPETRRRELVRAAARSFDDLATASARAEALDVLERGTSDLADDDAASLLAGVAASPAVGETEERALRLVARLGREGLREPLLEALAAARAPAAFDLLSEVLAEAGPMRLREGFADPRPAVRAASAAAVARTLDGPLSRDATARRRLSDLLTGGLRALLEDPDSATRVRAAAALGLLGDETALARLETLYGEGDDASKVAVAEALGRIGGVETHPLLVRILAEGGPGAAPIRAAAVRALAQTKHPNAIRLLVHYLVTDPDESVRDVAARSLADIGDEEARLALVDLLASAETGAERRVRVARALAAFEGPKVPETLARFLEDKNQGVVDEAALGLARHREASVVPWLVAILRRPEEPSRGRALDALRELTSTTPAVVGYEAAAEEYEVWHRTRRQGNDRSWFRDAVGKRGYDATSLEAYVRGERDLGAVPVLLRTIRDDDPVVRANSDLALRRVTGRSFGPVERTTPREEAARIADRWSDWWAAASAVPPSGPSGASAPR